MKQNELLKIQIQCLEKNLSNLEIKKERDLSKHNSEEEIKRLNEFYDSSFERVNEELKKLKVKLKK